MLRFSLFILGLLFICFTGFAQKKSETASENIKGIIVTEQKFEGSASKTFKESETYYDKKGNVVEEILYKEGKIDSHFKYQYDINGNKIKEIEFTSNGKVKKTSDYKYLGNLRIEKIVTDENGKIKSKKTYKYEKF